MEEEECDIFKFSGSGCMKAGRLLKKSSLGAKRKKVIDIVSDSPSSSSGSDGDDDGSENGGHSRKWKRPPHSKRSLAVSRLLNNKTPQLSGSDEHEKVETPPSPGDRSPSLSLLSSPNSSPRLSPHPSPPPPGLAMFDPSSDSATGFKVLCQANDVLNRLQYSMLPPSFSSECYEVSPTAPVSNADKMNLRIRCMGKVRKYNIEKSAPFSEVISLLSKDLELGSNDKLLLSHKTATLQPTESPLSRNLTTADIIDAVMMRKSDFPEQQSAVTHDCCVLGEDSTNLITIKVQTESKHKTYKISRDDPLHKVMSAFASELGIATSKLKFTFDGESVLPSQTTTDIQMEEDDCIDVRIC